jgi:hypothetical protein
MRKGLLAALAGLVLSAVAAPASAAEFGYGGSMRFNYQVGDPGSADVFFLLPSPSETHDFFEYRVRQFFNLKVNDHVSTDVKFEWNSEFGDERQFGGGSGDLQFGNATPQELQFRVKNAFVRFDVPGAPLTLTVGQQDFSTPKALISVEDGTGIKATVKAAGEHTIFWQKNLSDRNAATGAGDAHWFGIVPGLTLGGIKVSPHVSYAKAGDGAATLPGTEGWFLGLDTSGKLGAFGFTADVIYQTGETGVGGAVDYASFIVDASVTLAAGPGSLTIKGLYSPGDDNGLADGDLDSWLNVIATDMGWSPFFHDGSSNSNFAGSVTPGLGTGGIMAVGVEFALAPVKDLTVTPNAYYLMAAEDVNVAGGPVDDFYGIEAGVQVNWKVWDSVNLLGQLDYLFAGDVFENAAGNTDDAWRVIIGPSISW